MESYMYYSQSTAHHTWPVFKYRVLKLIILINVSLNIAREISEFP